MKSIIRIVTIVLLALSLTNTVHAQDKTFISSPALTGLSEKVEEAIPVILGVPMEELLEERVVTEVIARTTKSLETYQSTPEFRGFYWEARNTVYEVFSGHKLYDKVRILLLTRVKNHLHQPGKLEQLYSTNRTKFLESLHTLSVDQRGRLGLKLLSAQQTFAKMKDPAIVEIFKNIDEVRKKVDRDMARENPSDEAMAQAILSGEQIDYWDFDDIRRAELSMFPDMELAEFAWRRHCEGGDVLVEQYMRVIEMMSTDLLSVRDKG